MKHKQQKIYLKLGLLLFGIFIALIACQKDDNITGDENSINQIPKVKTISYDKTDAVFINLKAKYNIDNHRNTKLF